MSTFKNRTPKEPTALVSQFITYGINKLKINDIVTSESNKTPGRIQHTFMMETPEIKGNFEGYTDDSGHTFKGQIGRVKFGQYFDPNSEDPYDVKHREQFLDDIALMGEKAEVMDKLEAIPSGISWEDMLAKILEAFKGKFMWFIIAGEERDDKPGRFNLLFASHPVEKTSDGYTFSLVVKHANFVKSVKSNSERIITEASGVNVVGNNAGEAYVLRFDPKFHLKTVKKEKSDDNLGLGDTNSNLDNDLPF